MPPRRRFLFSVFPLTGSNLLYNSISFSCPDTAAYKSTNLLLKCHSSRCSSNYLRRFLEFVSRHFSFSTLLSFSLSLSLLLIINVNLLFWSSLAILSLWHLNRFSIFMHSYSPKHLYPKVYARLTLSLDLSACHVYLSLTLTSPSWSASMSWNAIIFLLVNSITLTLKLGTGRGRTFCSSFWSSHQAWQGESLFPSCFIISANYDWPAPITYSKNHFCPFCCLLLFHSLGIPDDDLAADQVNRIPKTESRTQNADRPKKERKTEKFKARFCAETWTSFDDALKCQTAQTNWQQVKSNLIVGVRPGAIYCSVLWNPAPTHP